MSSSKTLIVPSFLLNKDFVTTTTALTDALNKPL